MSKKLLENGSVSFCHGDNCVTINGGNSSLLANAAIVLILLVGLATLLKEN